MPKGNYDVSVQNTLRVRTELPKHNMTGEEISPSIRERNRRPDKQLYVPKARRLSDVKDKAKNIVNDASSSSNEPRKVLSSVQHKQTEESTGDSSRRVKNENGRTNGNGQIVPQEGMKAQQKEKRASKLPLQSDLLVDCLKPKPVGTPVASSDVATKKVTITDRDRIIVQRSSSGTGHSSDLCNAESHVNRQKKTEEVSKNNQVSSSVQTAKPRTRKLKPTRERTIVSNCIELNISSADVVDASLEESGEVCNPVVIKSVDVSLRHIASNSMPPKSLETVCESKSSQDTLRQLPEERLIVRAQTSREFACKTEIIDSAIPKDDICPKKNNGGQHEQAESEFPHEKAEISLEDSIDEPRCGKSHPETTLPNALEHDSDGNQSECKFFSETCEISAEAGIRESICNSGQTRIEGIDSRDETPVEIISKMDDPDCVMRGNEIMPEENDSDWAEQPKIKNFNKEFGIVMKSGIIESVHGRTQPEITLTSSRDNVMGMDKKVGLQFDKKKEKADVVNDKGTPPRTIVRVDKHLADSEASVTGSSCDDASFGDEDSWDAIYDDSGECMDQSVLAQLTSAVGNVSIEVPQIDYFSFQTKEPQISDEDFGHVVEIYNFPVEFKTEDLMSAFSHFKDRGFNIKWVNDTHALAVFSSRMAAEDALTLKHPIISTRPLSQGIKESKLKARRCAEFLQPYKQRPETSALLARRLVAGALGMHLPVSKQQREEERRKLREAKERKRLAIKQREDAWEGTVGNIE